MHTPFDTAGLVRFDPGGDYGVAHARASLTGSSGVAVSPVRGLPGDPVAEDARG